MPVEPAFAVAASVLSGLAVGLALGWLVPRPRRLSSRVRPYAVGSRTELGRSADTAVLANGSEPTAIGRLFGPPLRSLAGRLARWRLDVDADERLRLRLRQAGLLLEVPEEQRVQEYRVRQILGGFLGVAVGAVVSAMVGLGTGVVVLLGLLGGVVGASRWPSRVDRAIEDRRHRMRVELYTINHLLAMTIRVGGGPIQAVRRVVERGTGEVVRELEDVLVAHASGLSAAQAFERVAALSPEPSVARTLRLLASGSELGADLAEALRAISEDLRDARRESLRRHATRRRAAMLVPIIGILAPTMLLFVVAPIPSLIFGAR